MKSSGPGFLAHVPTIVLPDDERRALNDGRESTLYTGLHKLRRDVFDVLRPDLVVVFDSHWFTTVEFVITAAARRLGYYTSEELPRGMSSVPYDAKGDPAFATLVGAIADATPECWITPIDNEHLPIQYATTNFFPFLQGDEAWVSVSTCQTAAARGLRRGGPRDRARRSSASTGASSSSPRGRSATPSTPCARCASTRPPAKSTSSPPRRVGADHAVIEAWGAAITPASSTTSTSS